VTTKVRKARAAKDVKRAVRKLAPEDAKAILSGEEQVAEKKIVEAPQRKPGQTIEGAKVPWTRKDIEAISPIVEMISEENIKITWNGVTYQLLEGATHFIPAVIRDSYLRHRREMRLSGKSFGSGQGFDTVINLGAGAVDWAEE